MLKLSALSYEADSVRKYRSVMWTKDSTLFADRFEAVLAEVEVVELVK